MLGDSVKPGLISLRAHYRIVRHATDPAICVREARTAHGASMLPLHYEGWRLTHDLLGICAPRTSSYDGCRIENELVRGRPVHHYYAARLAGASRESEGPPWPSLWKALDQLWSSGRHGPNNRDLTVTTLWGTWFGIPRLAEAKWQVISGWWRKPAWSIASAHNLLAGRWRGGYTRPPEVALEIFHTSKVGLIVGDMHFANLVGSSDRIAFVDFSEVATAPIALDLAPLWLEWWLSQGLLRGDDGFIEGFRRLWRAWVGPERLLIRMTDEWIGRAFPWLYYTFFANHLQLARAHALELTMETLNQLQRLRITLTSADALDRLVTGCR